jgi:hypothetical protein
MNEAKTVSFAQIHECAGKCSACGQNLLAGQRNLNLALARRDAEAVALILRLFERDLADTDGAGLPAAARTRRSATARPARSSGSGPKASPARG